MDQSVIIQVIVTVGVIATGYLTYKSATKSSSKQSEFGVVGDLLDRVNTLESRQDKLTLEVETATRRLTVAAGFIDRIGYWIQGGYQGPRPKVPIPIRELIDESPWNDPAI